MLNYKGRGSVTFDSPYSNQLLPRILQIQSYRFIAMRKKHVPFVHAVNTTTDRTEPIHKRYYCDNGIEKYNYNSLYLHVGTHAHKNSRNEQFS